MTELQQFPYVVIKENYTKSNKQKTDTALYIVYWMATEEYDEHFVIYGKRPKSKVSGEFIPYRLRCQTMEQVQQLVKTVVSSDHNIAIELHHFYGYNDNSEDIYNIDWENTANDCSTELVAFDIEPTIDFNWESYLDFQPSLTSVLNVIMNHECV